MRKLNYFKNKPKATRIDVDEYLNRIGLKREEACLSFLKKLHEAHVYAIPFENLDIHYQQKIVLDYQKIFQKVVANKRGGFCYELNGLFYHLLYHLDFDCYLAEAQVMDEEKGYGKPFDHMIVIVKMEDQLFLVDVGFGDGFIFPKEVVLHKVQMDYTSYWKLEEDPDENYLLKVSNDASHFRIKYRFNLKEKEIIQFMEMCEYHQTSSESIFTKRKLAYLKKKEGSITLTDRILKTKLLGESSEIAIMNENEFLSKLEQYFGISYQQLLPVK